MALISIRDNEGRRWEITQGATVFEAFQKGPEQTYLMVDVVAALVNNTYANLWEPLYMDTDLVPVLKSSSEGARILRRTLCFVCAMAAKRLDRSRILRLGNALGDGYFFSFADGPISAHDLELLNTHLEEIIATNLTIEPQVLSWKDAIAFFELSGRLDTVALLSQHNPAFVQMFACEEWRDLNYGPLCARTGQLPFRRLTAHAHGFVLEHQGEIEPDSLQPFRRSPLLFSVYEEYRQWGQVLEVSVLSQLNDLAQSRKVQEFIWIAEALHQKKIADIAQDIANKGSKLRFILIAGPSSSGKTTFAKRLSIQLRVMGLKPIALSLDDYFVPRQDTPKDEQGNYDFEHLHAIDLDYLNQHLQALLAGLEIELPSFDFKLGYRIASGKNLRLPTDGIVIMEGIHGLNDLLTPAIDPASKYKIYVSALTQLNIDNLNRIATTDNRLLRRMVRDARYRGHSAEATLKMWPSVRRGENRNIFPFQDSATMIFNSALDYELGVLKNYADPLLRSVSPESAYYPEARRLMQFLDTFLSIPAEYIPGQSLLREFIGGSDFKY